MSEGEKPNRRPRRKRGRLILTLIAVIIVSVFALGMVLQVQGRARGYGNVTARMDPLLRASQKGPIAQILVEHDQQVSKGQIVICLDDSLAKANLQKDEKSLSEAAAKIDVYEASCELGAAQRQHQREQAGLQIKAAKHRLDQLLAGRSKGTVSSVELAEAQLAYDMAALQPEQSYKAQDELEKQELALLKEQLEAARAQVQLSGQQLSRLQILSPIDGRVVLNPLVVGEVVDANKVLGRVFDESSFTIEARFPERLLYTVKDGQDVEIRPTGRSRWAEPLTGRVLKVGRLVQPQDSGDGYFWVTITMEDQGVQLYPGQDAPVVVDVGKVSLFRSILGL